MLDLKKIQALVGIAYQMLPFSLNNPAASHMDLSKKQNKTKPNFFITCKRWLEIASKVFARSQTVAGISTMLLDEFGWCKHSSAQFKAWTGGIYENFSVILCRKQK